jgi:Raf kinase inhibitor-like YbhB/YbcL family protein
MSKRFFLLTLAVLSCLAFLDSFKSAKGHESISFPLTSPAFKDGEKIPRKYTRDGEDTSPPLSWSGASNGTKSYVIILEDPDALGGTSTHWVLYNLPATTTGLPEGAGKTRDSKECSSQGKNDFGRVGYSGRARPKRRTGIYSGYMPSTLQV